MYVIITNVAKILVNIFQAAKYRALGLNFVITMPPNNIPALEKINDASPEMI